MKNTIALPVRSAVLGLTLALAVVIGLPAPASAYSNVGSYCGRRTFDWKGSGRLGSGVSFPFEGRRVNLWNGRSSDLTYATVQNARPGDYVALQRSVTNRNPGVHQYAAANWMSCGTGAQYLRYIQTPPLANYRRDIRACLNIGPASNRRTKCGYWYSDHG